MIQAALRRVRKNRRFNRVAAAEGYRRAVTRYWTSINHALFAHLADGGFDAIARHVGSQTITKAKPSKADKALIEQLLLNFDAGDATGAMTGVVREHAIGTFEDAARFALRQMGVGRPEFELRNPLIRGVLEDRASIGVLATRANIDRTMATIVSNFYDLGLHPYDRDFIAKLKEQTGAQADYAARRLALTETGIAAEIAQHQTYLLNGVERKTWNATGQGTRPSHAELAGKTLDIAAKFDVGGHPADHPLDPGLPPDEVINCHCWQSPAFSDGWKLPESPWSGQ